MVIMEAVKHYCNRGEEPQLYFYRDQNGREIDLIAERNRELVPIEIKAAMTWHPDFAAAIPWFRALAPRSGRGIVVYAGDRRIESEEYDALPFDAFMLP
jgi:hypothetical protein